jgi:hypothetical protein
MVVVTVCMVSDVAFCIAVVVHAQVLNLTFLVSVNPPLKFKVYKEWAFLFVVYIPVYHGHMTHIRSFSNWLET